MTQWMPIICYSDDDKAINVTNLHCSKSIHLGAAGRKIVWDFTLWTAFRCSFFHFDFRKCGNRNWMNAINCILLNIRIWIYERHVICICTFIIEMNFVCHKRKLCSCSMFRHFYLFHFFRFSYSALFCSLFLWLLHPVIFFFSSRRFKCRQVRHLFCSVVQLDLLPNPRRKKNIKQNEEREEGQLNWEIMFHKIFSLSIKVYLFISVFRVDNNNNVMLSMRLEQFKLKNTILPILPFVLLSLCAVFSIQYSPDVPPGTRYPDKIASTMEKHRSKFTIEPI